MSESIKIEKVDQFYKATVTTHRWIRDDIERVYHSNGKSNPFTGMHWSCPDEMFGHADHALAARLQAALLVFSLSA